MANIKVSFSLPEAVVERLEKLSSEMHINKSVTIVLALEELEKKRKKEEVREK